jgi:flagellar protein FlaJ
LWDLFKRLSFRLFGNYLEPLVDYFESLRPDLQKSDIPLSLTEYVYVMFFSVFIVFIIEFPTLAFIAGFFMRPALAFFLSFTTTLFMCLSIFFFLYSYPTFVANRRAREIDSALPFITTYLASISASGVPPTSMFKVLSDFKEYKELSREASKIYRDTELFGMNLEQAMRKAALRTPSKEFKELLLGLITVLTSGSNLSNFFREKSRAFMQEYRRKLEEYSRMLSIMIEIYLTLIIIGSIFFIILSVIMSIFGAGSNIFLVFIQFIIVFFILPLVSIGFVLLLKTISPTM